MAETLQAYLQENILTLLVFSDKASPQIISMVEQGMFDSKVYKDIAQQAIQFYNTYHTAPKEHISDLLHTKLNSDEGKEGEMYRRVLTMLFESQDSVNEQFVLNELKSFVEMQTLKQGVTDAARLIKQGNVGSVKDTLSKAMSKTVEAIDTGFRLTDKQRLFDFYNEEDVPFNLGLKPLDRMHFGPARGELFVILGSANRGKTSSLVHIGKRNVLIDRCKVLHISLEMSEKKMGQRYVQSVFSLPKHKADVLYKKFGTDEMGRFNRFEDVELQRPTLFTFGDNGEVISNREEVTKMYDKIQYRFRNLWLKRFPTNSLTISGLETYLDTLYRMEKFVPDIVLLDYADLMKLDQRNLRIDTGNLYKELRRIAVERNIALVTPSQANRIAEDARTISLKHLGEDYSKAQTADNVVAICQTPAEERLHLARLFVAKARDEERGLTYMMSQALNMGQFCMDIHFMAPNYWRELDANTPTYDPDTDEAEGGNEPQNRQRGRVPTARRRRE